jgi:hypothetical protein
MGAAWKTQAARFQREASRATRHKHNSTLDQGPSQLFVSIA